MYMFEGAGVNSGPRWMKLSHLLRFHLFGVGPSCSYVGGCSHAVSSPSSPTVRPPALRQEIQQIRVNLRTNSSAIFGLRKDLNDCRNKVGARFYQDLVPRLVVKVDSWEVGSRGLLYSLIAHPRVSSTLCIKKSKRF